MSLPPRISQWWLFIKDAAQAHGIDPFLLAAIMDRESRGGDALDPPGPAGTGDHGHGRGLCQIDDRAHPEMVSQLLPDGRHAWQDPGANIAMGAQVLSHALTRFRAHPECPDAEIAAVAAYNAGEGAVRARMEDITRPIEVSSLIRELDHGTTWGNYVSDVLLRRSRFLRSTPVPIPPEEETT